MGLILVCLLTVGAALGVILDQKGPCRGWIASLRHRLQPTTPRTPPPAETPPPPPAPLPPTVVPTPPVAAPKTEPAEEANVVPPLKSDLEKRYEELYNRFLAELPKPRIGQIYNLNLLVGERIRGKLEKIEPGLVTLRVKYGTMAYPVHVISRADVLKLFPEIAARTQALATLQKEKEPKQPAPAPVPAVAEPLVADVATPSRPAGQPHYDPTPGPTPEELKPTLLAFGDWLKTQHRRVGGRIADKIFARRQSGCAVLYLRMASQFLAQDYGTRFQIAEGIQTFWGLRCESNAVATVARAHIVLLDQSSRIIGGSRPAAASEIWLSNK